MFCCLSDLMLCAKIVPFNDDCRNKAHASIPEAEAIRWLEGASSLPSGSPLRVNNQGIAGKAGRMIHGSISNFGVPGI